MLPELLAEIRAGLFRATVNGGVAVREDQALGNVPLEDELRFGLGLGLAIIPERFDLLAEVFGSTALADFADREVTPIEFLAGVKLWIAEAVRVRLAGGGGVTRGIGSPDLRAVASFGCELPSRSPDAPERPARRRSRRRARRGRPLSARRGRPRRPRRPRRLSRPRQRSRRAARPARSLPAAARRHRRLRRRRRLPRRSTTITTASQTPKTSAPREAEDDDSYEDEDGCPEPDNDVDGILDADDACPTAPGRVQERGCPKAVRIEEGRIVILDRVEFATGKAIILKASEPLLEEVRATIAANRRLTRIRIEGHTDDRGADRPTCSCRGAGPAPSRASSSSTASTTSASRPTAAAKICPSKPTIRPRAARPTAGSSSISSSRPRPPALVRPRAARRKTSKTQVLSIVRCMHGGRLAPLAYCVLPVKHA